RGRHLFSDPHGVVMLGGDKLETELGIEVFAHFVLVQGLDADALDARLFQIFQRGFDELLADALLLKGGKDGVVGYSADLGFGIDFGGDVTDRFGARAGHEDAIRIRRNIIIDVPDFSPLPGPAGNRAETLFHVLIDGNPIETRCRYGLEDLEIRFLVLSDRYLLIHFVRLS
ncbi:MAG: hypothetical protein QGH11_07935, partial [Pirellulaceae bacterium]|nr:hypothetical protein [Pirellulaceae bacterium]